MTHHKGLFLRTDGGPCRRAPWLFSYAEYPMSSAASSKVPLGSPPVSFIPRTHRTIRRMATPSQVGCAVVLGLVLFLLPLVPQEG
jgi:hypothetical protein